MGDSGRAAGSQRYFRTAPGEYDAGDRFLGLNAAQIYKLAAEFRDLPLDEIEKLMESHWHEARLARSRNLWERRIAVVATHYFIRHGEFDGTLDLAELLMDDTHDLIHKAVGWMLREVSKRDERTLLNFLDEHAGVMPRTALRYSIERLTVAQRKRYMAVPRRPRRR
jgi:3-methyladenine DNA glycosylase AlkD